MQEIFDKIKQRLQEELPGKKAQAKMSVPGRDERAEAKRKATEKPPRVSAVLILLFMKDGELHFPLILRPAYDGVHGGQMALPGGGREDQDGDLIDTALRECLEEVGFSVPKSQVLGMLTEFYIPPSNSLVTPIVAYSNEIPTYKIDPNEVDRVIEGNVPLFRNPATQQTKAVPVMGGKYSLQVPAFIVGGQTVWGATAMIMSEFMQVLDESGV